MSEPTSWASLALLIAIAAEKIMTRCDLYSAGVKSLHCQASKCLSFDVERSTAPPTPQAITTPVTTLTPTLSQAPTLPTLPTIASVESVAVNFAEQVATRLTEEAKTMLPPSVQKLVS